MREEELMSRDCKGQRAKGKGHELPRLLCRMELARIEQVRHLDASQPCGLADQELFLSRMTKHSAARPVLGGDVTSKPT